MLEKISVKIAIFNYISKSIIAVADAVAFIILTKELIISDYGIYTFSMGILSFFAFFIPLGIPSAFLRFIPEYIEINKKNIALFMVRQSLYIITILGFFLIVISIFITDKISLILNNDSLINLFSLLVFIGVLNTLIRIGEAILNALFLQIYRGICEVITSILQLFLFVIVLYYGFGVKFLIITIAFVSAFQILLYFTKIHIYFSDIKTKEKASKEEIKSFYYFSAKEYLFRISSFFGDMSFDIFLISYLLGSQSVGFWGFASSIAFFLLNWSPGMVVQSVVYPLFLRQYSRYNKSEATNNLFQFYNKFIAFFIFPIILCVWVLIDKFIIIIYQDKYIPAIFPLKILAISVMLQAFIKPLKNVFDVLKRNEIPLYINILIIYRIFASLILIKHYGITGAAYAYGSFILLIYFIQLFFIKRIIKVIYPIKSFLKILINSLAMAIVVIALKSYIENSLSWLIATILVGILVYLILSYTNKPFNGKERNLINEGLGIVAWRF